MVSEDGRGLPAGAWLDTWAAHDWSGGLRFDDLAPSDRLTIRTARTVYEIVVTGPATGAALVRGGRYFPDFTAVHVAGSSLGGGCLALRAVHAGLCLELVHAGRTILTSPVHEVRVARAR